MYDGRYAAFDAIGVPRRGLLRLAGSTRGRTSANSVLGSLLLAGIYEKTPPDVSVFTEAVTAEAAIGRAARLDMEDELRSMG